ncbi:MAG: FAD/NAD(P)-binding protein [Sulfolobales archaeon]|nr:FAD/NAD(P)-binding protein [Sulfolobales archaeon]MCX8208655.1 FAD/NAD(P)-binding protein [Sulfolobales archaeon]MDW8010313.1 FAD/NAD(P)-binding protein [Sulfolobales archaeon]
MSVGRLVPKKGRVARVVDEAPLVRTYHVEVEDFPEPLPGQFNVLYVKGMGEVVISVSDFRSGSRAVVEHTIRAVGSVTSYIYSSVGAGSYLGIRGPYGKGWPIREFEGYDVLVVGGGVGLAPLRPIIKHVEARRERFGHFTLLYGARRPVDMLFKYEYGEYSKIPNSTIMYSIDAPHPAWKGYVGFVTDLIDRVKLDPANTAAFVCGPEIMMKVTSGKLLKRGLREDRVFLSLERRCRCGIGICGMCQLGHFFICKDGPVLSYQDVGQYLKVRGI